VARATLLPSDPTNEAANVNANNLERKETPITTPDGADAGPSRDHGMGMKNTTSEDDVKRLKPGDNEDDGNSGEVPNAATTKPSGVANLEVCL
jgi:hypothetical protein